MKATRAAAPAARIESGMMLPAPDHAEEEGSRAVVDVVVVVAEAAAVTAVVRRLKKSAVSPAPLPAPVCPCPCPVAVFHLGEGSVKRARSDWVYDCGVWDSVEAGGSGEGAMPRTFVLSISMARLR
jgi:hypothetical protein